MAPYSHRVRSYELDIYGHVNNAVYMQWLEHGRSQLLQQKGFTYTSITDHWGVRLVTVATHINFKAQLGLDDHVEIRTTVKKMGKTSVTFDQQIVRIAQGASAHDPRLAGEVVAADCETVICFTDPQMKGSVAIPEKFRELYG